MSLGGVFVPLFVPADRPERFAKAAGSGADAIIIDLEDAVAPANKEYARASLRFDFPDIPVWVRINGENTEWFSDDVAAISDLPVTGIVVPRAELGGILREFVSSLRVPIIALIETVRGLAQARQIAELPSIHRLAFGSVDFCADAGCAHNQEVLLPARWELVVASRLAGLSAPIDGVTTSISDVELIASESRAAQELGYMGKMAIHPYQVAPVRKGFRPNDAEIEWARKVLASGESAVAIEGAMIDRPVRVKAQSIIDRSY